MFLRLQKRLSTSLSGIRNLHFGIANIN